MNKTSTVDERGTLIDNTPTKKIIEGGRAEHSVTVPTIEQISSLAHHYWKERGCPTGSPEADWFRAEHESQFGLTARNAALAEESDKASQQPAGSALVQNCRVLDNRGDGIRRTSRDSVQGRQLDHFRK